jgi:hypothetical protein
MQKNEDYMDEAGKPEMEPLKNTESLEKTVHNEEKQAEDGIKIYPHSLLMNSM